LPDASSGPATEQGGKGEKGDLGPQGPRGPQGVGYKLASDWNYDLENKKILNLEVLPDHKADDAYERVKNCILLKTNNT